MASSEAGVLEALLATLEQTLDTERDALLQADTKAITVAADDKLHTLNALDACTKHQGFPGAARSRLHAVAVANARNQVLLSVLQARVESRMDALGLLSPTYGPTGRAAAHANQRSAFC
ncbi:MAG: hypothetical protein EPN72_13900 [Nevskiaceae bacterium]|nr:MAG: hypothetical protein EPN63_14230 [Nevskiaceae bacterium]TBR71551.1 MAG: hypothetical protein EPN72_13900 [Nevskiaceae bacterium]